MESDNVENEMHSFLHLTYRALRLTASSTFGVFADCPAFGVFAYCPAFGVFTSKVEMQLQRSRTPMTMRVTEINASLFVLFSDHVRTFLQPPKLSCSLDVDRRTLCGPTLKGTLHPHETCVYHMPDATACQDVVEHLKIRSYELPDDVLQK